MKPTEIFDAISKERNRQRELKACGKFKWTCADTEPSRADKLAVLAEEFGEVARAVCDEDAANLRDELVQVATVAFTWLESL